MGNQYQNISGTINKQIITSTYNNPKNDYEMDLRKTLLLLLLSIAASCPVITDAQERFPQWKEGEMEIHHINTGKGESVFCILPDGTTLLIDAGDIGNGEDPRNTRTIPDSSREAGEWIARYISGLIKYRKEKSLDYVLLTHFHGDHMGAYSTGYPKTKTGGDYIVNGLTEVAEYLPFSKMIDRDYPTYNYPGRIKSPVFGNYKRFVDWNITHRGMKAERFIPGSNKQFTLLYNPVKYQETFEIRNIVANGEVWTGVGSETRHHFPELKDLKPGETIHENNCSAGIRISYGRFDYFNGGDITGSVYFNSPLWTDIETPVAKALGPVEVCEVNHHGWRDAMNEYFIAAVRPQVFVMQVWNVSHFGLDVLARMQSQNLYAGERDIFATNTPQISRDYISESRNMKRLKGDRGHVVIKVQPGGQSYHVYMLDDMNENYAIKSMHGPYICR